MAFCEKIINKMQKYEWIESFRSRFRSKRRILFLLLVYSTHRPIRPKPLIPTVIGAIFIYLFEKLLKWFLICVPFVRRIWSNESLNDSTHKWLAKLLVTVLSNGYRSTSSLSLFATSFFLDFQVSDDEAGRIQRFVYLLAKLCGSRVCRTSVIVKNGMFHIFW